MLYWSNVLYHRPTSSPWFIGLAVLRDVRVWNTLFFNAIATVGVCVFLLLCYHRSAGVIYSFLVMRTSTHPRFYPFPNTPVGYINTDTSITLLMLFFDRLLKRWRIRFRSLLLLCCVARQPNLLSVVFFFFFTYVLSAEEEKNEIRGKNSCNFGQ